MVPRRHIHPSSHYNLYCNCILPQYDYIEFYKLTDGMISHSITTLYYAGSPGIHFQMQEHNKAHASQMELCMSACEGRG